MLSLPVIRALGFTARRRVVSTCDRLAWQPLSSASLDFGVLYPHLQTLATQIRTFHTSNKLFATHYEILGLSKTASADEIRKAYRQKAKQYHPDLNKDASAQAKFVAVKEAYECLKDSGKRAHYDATLGGFDPLRNAGSSAQRQRAGYQAPHQWEFKQAEEKMWREYRETRHKAWSAQNSKMDEEMRKSEEMEALRKRIMPFFNALLVVSLVAIGASSLWVQLNDRKSTGPTRHFASEQSPDVPLSQQIPNMIYPPPAMDYTEAYPRHHTPKRYSTRWEEVHEAVQRRDEFYRALLRNEDTSSTASQWSQPTV